MICVLTILIRSKGLSIFFFGAPKQFSLNTAIKCPNPGNEPKRSTTQQRQTERTQRTTGGPPQTGNKMRLPTGHLNGLHIHTLNFRGAQNEILHFIVASGSRPPLNCLRKGSLKRYSRLQAAFMQGRFLSSILKFVHIAYDFAVLMSLR